MGIGRAGTGELISMYFVASVAVLAEIILVITAAFSVFRHQTDRNAIAYCYAVVLTLASFSVAIFTAFFIGVHQYFYLFDMAVLTASSILIYRNWQILRDALKAMREFCLRNPVFSIFIVLTVSIPWAKGFLMPPTTIDSMTYNLMRVMLMMSEGQMFAENFGDYRLDIMQVGHDILHFLFLRFHTDYGLATFGFLSYSVIIAGTFAAADKLWDDAGLAKSLAVISASLTMFVLHAASTKNDLVLGAMAVVALIAILNHFDQRRRVDLFIFVTALSFGVAAKMNFGIFAAFLFIGYLWTYIRRWGLSDAARQSTRLFAFGYGSLMLIPIGCVLTLLIAFQHNFESYGHIMGPEFFLPASNWIDGWHGAFLNLIRFFVQSVGLPYELFGMLATEIHNALLGDSQTLGLKWWPDYPVFLETFFYPHEEAAWFGPLGLIFLVALGAATFGAKGPLQAFAIAAFATALITALTVGWSPWIGRYHALSFAAGVITLGMWLKYFFGSNPKITRVVIRLMMAISVANLMFLTIIVSVNDWAEIQLKISKRDATYSWFYGKTSLWDLVTSKLPPGSEVLLITGVNKPIFPLYLRRPDVKFTNVGVALPDGPYREPFRWKGEEYNLTNIDDLKKVRSLFDQVILVQVPKELSDILPSQAKTATPPSPDGSG